MWKTKFNEVKRNMSKLLFRKLKDVPKTLDDLMADAEATLKDEPAAGMQAGLPSVSVGSIENPKDILAVKFETDAVVEESKKEPGKFYAWAEVEMLYAHEGWNSQDKEACDLQKGDHARINLCRHANLRNWFEKNKPLKGRSFIIGTLGRVKTKKGSAFDYRIKEITGQAL